MKAWSEKCIIRDKDRKRWKLGKGLSGLAGVLVNLLWNARKEAQ